MATCFETYTWDVYGTALQTYLGITVTAGSADELDLQGQLEAAGHACDAILLNPFTDDDTYDDDAVDTIHPAAVKGGVFRWVKLYRARLDLNNDLPGAAMSQKTGDEELNQGVTLGGVDAWATYASDVVKPLLQGFRLLPWK